MFQKDWEEGLSRWAPVDTTWRRPRSPVLGRLYTQLLPDYSQEPPAHRALSYYPVPSSCIWLLSQTHPQRITTFCCHTDLLHCSLATRTGTRTWSWRSCALLSNCLGGHQGGTHVPPKPFLCFSFYQAVAIPTSFVLQNFQNSRQDCQKCQNAPQPLKTLSRGLTSSK